MNKQSNLYSIIYIVVLVCLVGAGLAFTSISLKDRQQANADADKMRQILASVRIYPEDNKVSAEYERYITDTYVVNEAGQRIDGVDAFDVNVANQVRLQADSRELPVFVCTLPDGEQKYILPLYGAGLWGPIWGYISVNADGQTVYGAYFAHQGETPGLGAEIEKPAFSSQFEGKRLFENGTFEPVHVVKAGLSSPDDPHSVDGVSGGTITSKGVGAMIDNCLAPYQNFLKSLQ